MPDATVNGVRIAYEDRGSGPPLLLLMGFGAPAAFWSEEFLDRMARSFRVIAPDNRGTGGSDRLERDAPFEIATMADDAAALLRELGIERADVFGVSMGGMIAQEFVLRHPDLVRRLVLGCTHPGKEAVLAHPAIVALLLPERGTPPREAIGMMWQAMVMEETRRDRADFLDVMTDRLLAVPTPARTLLAQRDAIARLDTWDRLPTISAPTLVIAGDRDVLVPPENSRRIAAHIPGARLVIVPDAAHNFMWEAQEETARAVEDFLLTL